MGALIDLDGLGYFKGRENSMIAAEYSAAKTYSVGDYVYYNGTLYRCTTAISTAEAWTVAHWTAAKLADDVAEQSEALESAIVGKEDDITSMFTFVDSKRIRWDTGAYQGGTSYARIKANQSFVNIDGYDSLKITMVMSTGSSSTNGLAFYSTASESSYISGVSFITGSQSEGAVLVTIEIPENAKYVRTTYWKDSEIITGWPLFSCYGIKGSIVNRISSIEELANNTKEVADAAVSFATEQELTDAQKKQARSNIDAATGVPRLFNLRSQERVTIISDMQAGHGFTNPLGTGNAPADDTEDYIFGSQSVEFNHCGQKQISSSGIDLTNKILSVTFKVDTIADGQKIILYLSENSGFSSYKNYTLYTKQASDQFKTDEWATVTISSVRGGTTGTVDLSKIKYLRLKGDTSSVAYHVQSIGYREVGEQRPCISFTFDDGWSEQMDGAKILGKYNIPATAYIFRTCQLTLSQLKSLKFDYGWDIEMHGSNTFTSETEEELVTELTTLQAYIRENGLGRGEHLAYPGGQNNRDVVNIVSRFCKTGRTINNASSSFETVPTPMPYNLRAVSSVGASGTTVTQVKALIDSVAQNNGWLILVFHRIGDTATTMFCSASDLEAIADYAVKSGADIKTVADMWER